MDLTQKKKEKDCVFVYEKTIILTMIPLLLLGLNIMTRVEEVLIHVNMHRYNHKIYCRTKKKYITYEGKCDGYSTVKKMYT